MIIFPGSMYEKTFRLYEMPTIISKNNPSSQKGQTPSSCKNCLNHVYDTLLYKQLDIYSGTQKIKYFILYHPRYQYYILTYTLICVLLKSHKGKIAIIL